MINVVLIRDGVGQKVETSDDQKEKIESAWKKVSMGKPFPGLLKISHPDGIDGHQLIDPRDIACLEYIPDSEIERIRREQESGPDIRRVPPGLGGMGPRGGH